MKKNKKRLILLFAVMINLVGMSQVQNQDSYIIITFEFDRKEKNHAKEEYYWIINADSILDAKDLKLYPLYFDEFSIDDLNECMGKKEINIFTMFKGENFVFDKTLNENVRSLKKIIQTKNRRVQSIIKRWDKSEERITIYLTPVFGVFCSSNIADFSGKEINYKGAIYLPVSNFKPNLDFFDTEKAKLIQKVDFSNYKFINKLFGSIPN